MSDPKQPPKPKAVELYYDVRDQGYLYRLNGRYMKMKKSDLKTELKTLGYRDNEYVKTGIGYLPQIELPFHEATHNRAIDFADSLAGHRSGIFKDGAARCYLVVDEARGIWDDLPKKIKPPEFFQQFLCELLPGVQSHYLCHWLAIGLHSLRRGDFQPGQMVALCGPAGSGKGLLQLWITEIFGGRSADPFRYMTGETNFNKDLAGAEHLAIEDPPTTTDIRTRRQFGSMLKQLCVNLNFSIHGKTKDAISLPVWHRISISLNSETENVAVLPPFDESIQDKIFLFRCDKVSKAFNPFRGKNGTPNLIEESLVALGKPDRKLIWDTCLKEIPMIRAWLLSEFLDVPDKLSDDRYGIRAYHHPELLAQLSSLAPEMRLMNIIDMAFFGDTKDALPQSKWEGKTIELEQALRDSKFGYEATQLIGKFHNACGTYMGRLAQTVPNRISQRKLHGYTLWTIKPPCEEKADTNGIV